MRPFTIVLVTAFLLLLAQRLTAAPPWLDREEESGSSQAVVAGSIRCNFDNEDMNSFVEIQTGSGLGVIGLSSHPPTGTGFGTPSLALALFLPEECSPLIDSLAEQVPHPVCEIGSTRESTRSSGTSIDLSFLCTGRTDAVIAGVGEMARAVNRLGQP